MEKNIFRICPPPPEKSGILYCNTRYYYIFVNPWFNCTAINTSLYILVNDDTFRNFEPTSCRIEKFPKYTKITCSYSGRMLFEAYLHIRFVSELCPRAVRSSFVLRKKLSKLIYCSKTIAIY